MNLSTLKLVMEKGSVEGEAREYKSKPGFTICIGRIVRGNTFAIKDNGISSKHLSIKCCSHDKWVVKDLESSNGTLLNSSPLPPLTEHDLRDGDVLKIGEVTSIRVQISHFTDSQPVGRNLRSGARVLSTANSEGVHVVSDERNPRGRGCGHLNASVDLEEDKEGRGLEEGKGEAKSGAEGSDLDVNTEIDVAEVGVWRGRSQGKGDIVLQKLEMNSEISENVEGITENGVPPLSNRRTRSRVKLKDNSTFTSDLERIPEASQLAGSDNREVSESVAPKEKRHTRATRGRKKKVVEIESAQSVTAVEQIPTKSMSNIAEEEEEELASELITEHENCNEMEVIVVDQDGRREPRASKERVEEVEIAPDLNNMTLGEWFDYLERLLPRQIRAEANQVIQDVLKRSKQFHEFVLQQQKDKGKQPLG